MQHLDFQRLTEAERVATYGAFFAMAIADGSLDDDELVNIFECLDLDGLSDESIRAVRSYLIDPPTLDDTLAMSPSLRLSNFGEVTLGARVSKSGNATPQSGDLTATLSPVTRSPRTAHPE